MVLMREESVVSRRARQGGLNKAWRLALDDINPPISPRIIDLLYPFNYNQFDSTP